MLIEDLIQILASGNSPHLNRWDSNILDSIANQIYNKLALTEKQSQIALKILKRNQPYLNQKIGTNIDNFLDNPKFRYPFRVISSQRSISIRDDQEYGKVLKIEFPYNESILSEIRKGRERNINGIWVKEEKSWILPLTETNLAFLQDICEKFEFTLTENVHNLFAEVKNVKENLDNYIPMLSYEKNDLKFVNFPENLPQIESKDPLSAVFEARKKGVFVWDNEIDKFLHTDKVKSITKEFLSSQPGEDFHINPQKIEFLELDQIITQMFPAAFIIPGGSELEKLTTAYSFLEKMGIGSHEISVLFRLPNETHKIFNDFVKSNGLNSPLSNDTKVVFLSSKVPKTVVKFTTKFNLIVNLGYNNVHYTMRDFVKKHENMIYYCTKTSQQEIDFADL